MRRAKQVRQEADDLVNKIAVLRQNVDELLHEVRTLNLAVAQVEWPVTEDETA